MSFLRIFLLVLLLSLSQPLFVQNALSDDRRGKSDFSEPGTVETQQDPVDYRSGDSSKPKQTPPAENNSGKKIPAAEALPKLEAIEKEFLSIANQTGKMMKALSQKYPITLGGTDCCETPCYDYIKAHAVENGVPGDWISDSGRVDLYRPPDFPDDHTVAVLGGIDIDGFGREGGLNQAFFGLTFENLYGYHLFLIKKAIQETKTNGFFLENELKKMEKGFENWKKTDAQVRDLFSQQIPESRSEEHTSELQSQR